MFRRSKNRHTALRLPGKRFFLVTATISFNVKLGCSTISPSKNSACSSSGEVLPHGRNAAGFFPPLRPNHYYTRAELVWLSRLTARRTGLLQIAARDARIFICRM
jgi:hypothetical protein